MKIAICGKGGAGKTTAAACLARLLAKRGYLVYVVDADPDGSLGAALNIPTRRIEALKPVIGMREFVDEVDEDGALYLLDPNASSSADEFCADISLDGDEGAIRFFRMSAPKMAGTSCYCREYGFLRALINSMTLGSKEVAILDMSAGTEHMVRGVVKSVDMTLVMTEASRASVDMAKSIKRMSAQLGIPMVRFIGNKSRGEKDDMFIRANFPRDELLGCARFCDAVAERALGLAARNENADDGAEDIAPAALSAILEKAFF